jgi:hypothetical protein
LLILSMWPSIQDLKATKADRSYAPWALRQFHMRRLPQCLSYSF